MLTTAFWIGTFDRAVTSFAQALLLLWGADAGFNIVEVNLPGALGIAAGAVVLSILTSLVSAPVGEQGTTSFLPGGH
jgi:hypothetical protein